MTITLAVIFGFMFFLLILNKGHLFFLSIFSFLAAAAISFGVGYALAVFVVALMGPILKLLLGVAGGILALVLLSGLFTKE